MTSSKLLTYIKNGCPDYHEGKPVCDDCLTEGIQGAVNNVWEDAARIICHRCRDGLTWISDEYGVIFHVEASGKVWPCEAAAIHARKESP